MPKLLKPGMERHSNLHASAAHGTKYDENLSSHDRAIWKNDNNYSNLAHQIQVTLKTYKNYQMLDIKATFSVALLIFFFNPSIGQILKPIVWDET